MGFDKIREKWSPILSSLGLSGNSWLEEYCDQSLNFGEGIIDSGSTPSISAFDWNKPLLPMAMKIQATTLGGGGWVKSKKQQLKENRINKLLKIKGKKPNVILPNDEFVHGLVSVKPLSMPTSQLFYMDFKYGKSIKQQRKEKLIRILRKEKMEYIDEILKNN